MARRQGWRYSLARMLLPEIFGAGTGVGAGGGDANGQGNRGNKQAANSAPTNPIAAVVPWGAVDNPSLAPNHHERQVLMLPDDLPFVVAAAETGDATAKSLLGERGVTGLNVRDGRIYQEYSDRLQNLQSRMTAFEEMRRSDSAPAALEAVLTFPLREAQWRIEPGEDLELADRIERNLRDELTSPFSETLRVSLLAVLYGFTVVEKVFEYKPDGFLGWRKFAERERSTVKSWQFDETGGLSGIVQQGRNPQTSALEEYEIPIEKLLVWSWRPDANNPEGLGCFRQAYKHWMYKQYLEEFAAIRIERQACGIPVAYGPPERYDQTERDAVLAILKRIRTGKDTGIVVPDGWRIELLSLGPADVPFEAHLERQHQSMLQTLLAHFVGLGSGGDSGAWALSRDSSSFFLMGLCGISDWQCEYFNRYAIPQLVSFNTSEQYKKLPKLARASIGTREVQKFTAAVKNLFLQTEKLPADIEEWTRAELDMPAMLPDAAADTDADTDTDTEPEPKPETDTEADKPA
ncbi:MAG: hypothetical protein WC977_07805 [Anaerovoracaceae bacterium]